MGRKWVMSNWIGCVLKNSKSLYAARHTHIAKKTAQGGKANNWTKRRRRRPSSCLEVYALFKVISHHIIKVKSSQKPSNIILPVFFSRWRFCCIFTSSALCACVWVSQRVEAHTQHWLLSSEKRYGEKRRKKRWTQAKVLNVVFPYFSVFHFELHSATSTSVERLAN